MERVKLHRGDLVVCVSPGDFGKPRPAVIVQSDLFNTDHPSVVICPVSSTLTGNYLFRVPLDASRQSGLKEDSEIMVDKITALRPERIRQRIGRLTSRQLATLNQALRLWLDLEQ